MFFSVTTKNSIQLLGRVHEKPMHRGDCFNKISLKKIITIASKLSPQVVNIDDGTQCSLMLLNQNYAINNHLKLKRNRKIFV